MKHDLPVEPAERRLYKLNWLAQFCSSFDRGCSEAQLMKEALSFGNASAKAVEYINVIQLLGLVTKRGNKFYVDELNYIEWAEVKGYRKRYYRYKCEAPNCPVTYTTKKPRCPKCGTPNPFFNEPHPSMHIESDSLPYAEDEYGIRGTTEPYIGTYTETPTPRQGRVKAGREAELRVRELMGGWGETTIGPGRGGRPDVYFTVGEVRYAVEVKSIENQVKTKDHRYKATVVSLSRGQWTGLCGQSDIEGLIPLLVVEVKIRGSKRGHLYHFIERGVVDRRVELSPSSNIRISVHDLSSMGRTVRPGVGVPGEWFL